MSTIPTAKREHALMSGIGEINQRLQSQSYKVAGVLAAMIVAVGGVNCGGSSKTTTSPSATTDSTSALPASSTAVQDSALRQSVEAYSSAYLGDRPSEAYTLLSARCQAQITSSQMASLTHGAKLLYGAAKLIDYHEDQVIGNSARVTYAYDQPAINQSGQRWTREAGQWHWDAC